MWGILLAGVLAARASSSSSVCRESTECDGFENMCDCRGFEATAFQPALEVFTSALDSSLDGFKEGTCGYANAACDLKWATLCCDLEEGEQELSTASSEFQPVEEASGGTGLLETIETHQDFCKRFGLAGSFDPERIAYPGGGFKGLTGHEDGTCGNVVAMSMSQFAKCCCEAEEYCCPQGEHAEDCLSRRELHDLHTKEMGMSYSYSYSFSTATEEDGCSDSTSWHKMGETSKDCMWVAAYSEGRCDAKGVDRSLASYSCPAACGSECNDVTAWYKKGATSKNCAWVSVYPSGRCDVKGWDGTMSDYACPDACGVEVAMTDSDAWYKTDEPSKDCTWVSQFSSARCDTKGWDGSFASESCPRACSSTDDAA
ncbi:hypothetical protein CTAYLR_009628 [Chrysophaeum taylorii]|uniref:Uncharacterized protein n=1 Tax=Chrysophaeum taylorii TaxID=2483200 RepID=A0AAD7XKZ0_9STRA|nr:hypothetical protein CTAYLR_009628 [Chrysophaeum taylorii]